MMRFRAGIPVALALLALLSLTVLSVLTAGCLGQASSTGTPETIAPAASATAVSITTATAGPVSDTPTAVTPAPGFSPTPPPSSSPSSGLTPTELKYRLIAQFGDPFFCDPDQYPVARVITEDEFERRFAEIQKNAEAYQRILQHLGLAGQAVLSPDQKRLVYEEYKKLNAVMLQPAGGKYQFILRIPAGQRSGSAMEGLIDAAGSIAVTKQQPSFNTCPICLAADTRLATPNGEIAVQDLQKGMPVWTADASGVRHPAVILSTVRRDASLPATILHLVLQDGRELFVSPGHPLPDGRMIGSLASGDSVDETRVVSVEPVPYQEGMTYDILPSGGTGLYWANGILLKSTLAP
jgi:hypothetical protein